MGNCIYFLEHENENEFINSKKKISSKNYFKKDNDNDNDFNFKSDFEYLESDSESSCDSDYYYQYFFLM
jgi:hypothetical protein